MATFAALARGALGESYSPEVPQRMVEMLDKVATEAEVNQLVGALKAADSRAGALVMTGRPVPVSWLGEREAETVVGRWHKSRVPQQRQLVKSVLALALASAYGHPGPEWDRMGYPGPMDRAPDEPARLEPLDVRREGELSCDVVVVGSGAGGACVASELASEGFDVIVVERGGYFHESDFDHLEAKALRELYLYGATLATVGGAVRILAGSALGGGTLVNYSTSFKTPGHVLHEWTALSGIDAFASGEFEQSLDAVSARLGVNTDSSAAGRRDEVMEEGLKKLGWHVDLIPRAVRGCAQDEQCGYCGFGCRLGAKQSSMRTYLEDAAGAGARIVVDAHVRKVEIADGRARGVEMEVGGRTVNVRARAVVVAAGAIETPALLLRSRLNGEVGKHLRLHPGTGVLGLFDEEIRPWEGTLQARYSSEFRAWDDNYGPIMETVPVHPGAAAAAFPWVSSEHHRRFMGEYGHVGLVAVLPRDRCSGRIRIGRDGSPRVHYALGAGDERRIGRGVMNAARVLEAAGANEICSLHDGYLGYRPDEPGAHERWSQETASAGYARKATLVSYHQMGSCRMGSDPGTSAVNASNESHQVGSLFVADASCFPTASGVNPMLTVYGIAHRAAKKIIERLG
jgi:choline dehydrogenase-like flavoprotein